MMTPYVVTRYYRAPEVILGMGYKENGECTRTSLCAFVRVGVWREGEGSCTRGSLFLCQNEVSVTRNCGARLSLNVFKAEQTLSQPIILDTNTTQ